MPKMASREELFVHELKDMYYAEKTLTKVLPTLAKESKDAELTKAFQHHLAETKTQVTNLERVFKQIGEQAVGEKCPGIDGIKEEHDTFVKEHDASAEVLDMFLTGAAARAEHYEIAAYTGLIAMARALGQRESAELLEQNLAQEKEALKTVETISKRILKAPGNGRTTRAGSTTASR